MAARKTITRLTPEQEAQLDGWAQKYIEIGLRTGPPTDRPALEAAIAQMYRNAELPAPKISYVRSPVVLLKRNGDSSEGICWGQHDAEWVGFYSFFRRVVGVKGLDAIIPFETIAEQACWFLPLDDECIVCERADALHVDDAGEMHSEGGRAAIAWGDGALMLYFWHGIPVPPEAFRPGWLTMARLRKEPNVEIRRALLEIAGPGFIERTQKPVQRDDAGALYKFKVADRDLAVVVVTNGTQEPDGSYRQYMLAVPPETETAWAGVAATYGKDVAHYAPQFRT